MDPVVLACLITTSFAILETQKLSTFPGIQRAKPEMISLDIRSWCVGPSQPSDKDVEFCGHAIGGAIALLYAIRYPEELKGLIHMGK